MSYDEDTTNSIQQPAMGKFLQVSGFEKNLPRAVVYGSYDYGGLAMPQLYADSSCCKIQTIITHVNSDTHLGKLTIVDIEWLQLTSGISESIINTRQKINYIDNNWLLSVKEFLNTTNATIDIKDIWLLIKKRMNDLVLMDEILKLEMTKQDIWIFNNWRIFFQVFNLSDITTQQGTHIRAQYLSKSSSTARLGRHDLKWPNQERPNNKYFGIWVRGIITIANLVDDNKLGTSLGEWINQTRDISQQTQSPFMLHKNNQIIAILDDNTNQWHQHLLHHTERTKQFYKISESLHMPTLEMTEYNPVDVIVTKEYYTVNPCTNKQNKTKNNKKKHRTNKSISERLELIEDWTKEITSNLTTYNDEIWKSCKDKTINIATDAGVKRGDGGFGIAFECDNKIIMECSNRVPIIFNELHSYRAEGVGIMCGLIIIKQIQNIQKELEYYSPATINIICDNEAMIKSLRRYRYKKSTPKTTYLPEMDVIREIINNIKQLESENIQVTLTHIKVHQDRTGTELTNEAKLNIRADELASKAQTMRKIKSLNIPSSRATLNINGLAVTSGQSASMRQIYHSIQMREFLENSNNWNGNTIDTVWWKVHGPAIAAMGQEKTTIQKFIHGRLPCNQRNNKYYPYKPSLCSTCTEDTIEEQLHFLKCKCCPERQSRRERFLKELKNNLISLGTHETTTRVLMYNISSCINDEPIKELHEIAPDASIYFKSTIHKQQKIGWEQLLKGRFSIKWGELYNHNIENDKQKITLKDAEQWGKKIILIIWKFVADMWRIRNEKEHNLDGNNKEIEKMKEGEQIKWIIKALKEFDEDHPYMNITTITKHKKYERTTTNLVRKCKSQIHKQKRKQKIFGKNPNIK
jgi:hypothetical protein